jgi:hypothetical protein
MSNPATPRDDRTTSPDKGPVKIGLLLTTFGVAVAALWALSWLAITWAYGRPDSPGTFGDMFGAVNSLFTGLAFAGLIITILLQKQELALQRQELRETKEELRRSADAQIASGHLLARQASALRDQADTMLLTARINALTFVIGMKEREIEQFKKARTGMGVTTTVPDEARKAKKRTEEQTEIIRHAESELGILRLELDALLERTKGVGALNVLGM